MPSRFQKIEARIIPVDFCNQNILARGDPLWPHSIDCFFVSGSYWYNQVSSMVTNRARQEIIWIPPNEKIPNFLRRLVPLTLLIHVQAFWGPLRGELPHVQIFMNDGPNPLTWDAQLLSYWFSRNAAVSQDSLVNLVNNLRGGHCFTSSGTRYNTGGKITMLKLDHPVFDGGIRLCMFP